MTVIDLEVWTVERVAIELRPRLEERGALVADGDEVGNIELGRKAARLAGRERSRRASEGISARDVAGRGCGPCARSLPTSNRQGSCCEPPGRAVGHSVVTRLPSAPPLPAPIRLGDPGGRRPGRRAGGRSAGFAYLSSAGRGASASRPARYRKSPQGTSQPRVCPSEPDRTEIGRRFELWVYVLGPVSGLTVVDAPSTLSSSPSLRHVGQEGIWRRRGSS
jgi:hypothetical protein